MPDKTCTRCGGVKSLDAFPMSRIHSYGRHAYCRSCMADVSRANYQRKKTERIKQTSAYRRAHPEAHRISTQKWRETNPEKYHAGLKKSYPARRLKAIEYVANHREHVRHWQKEWHLKNKAAHNARSALYRKANRDRVRLQIIDWQRRNPEMVIAAGNRRRARVSGAPGKFTGKEWKDLKAQYGNRCLACGEVRPLAADHVIPIAKGGANSIDNIQPLCKPCNSRKNIATTDYRIMKVAAI